MKASHSKPCLLVKDEKGNAAIKKKLPFLIAWWGCCHSVTSQIAIHTDEWVTAATPLIHVYTSEWGTSVTPHLLLSADEWVTAVKPDILLTAEKGTAVKPDILFTAEKGTAVEPDILLTAEQETAVKTKITNDYELLLERYTNYTLHNLKLPAHSIFGYLLVY